MNEGYREKKKRIDTNMLFASILGSVKVNVENAGGLRNLPVETCNVVHLRIARVDDQVANLAQKVILVR